MAGARATVRGERPARAAGRVQPGESADELAEAAAATVAASRALLGMVVVSLTPALDRVTLPQFRALVLLSVLGPVRIGVLAERLGVHQSTLTRTAARLDAAALIRRMKNPENRREVILEITPHGSRLVRTVTRRRYREIQRALATLSAEERATVVAGMELFARAAREPGIETLAALGG